MLTSLNLKAYFTLGLTNHQSFHEKRDIIFINQAALVLIISALIILIANIVSGNYLRAMVPLNAIPMYLLIPYFQRKQQYFKAKLIAAAGAFVVGVCTSLLFGIEAKTHFYLLPSFILSLVLFTDRGQHLFSFLIHFLVFTFLLMWGQQFEPVFVAHQASYMANVHYPVIFTCVYLTLSEYLVHYKRYEIRINDLMESVQEKNEMLEIEKTRFEVQTQILTNTNEQLLNEIDYREKAEQKLLASNTELEQFAYVASHDLKEPLRTIGSFTQLLKKRIAHAFDEESDSYYEYIVSGVDRMTNLLDDLLSLSQLNREIDIKTVDLEKTVSLTKHNLHHLVEKNKGEIIVSAMPTINGNFSQLNLIFQNLISNGLKFTRDGVDPVIEIDCKELDDHYQFSVKDNGIGIKKEYAEKIFIIFQRLDKRSRYEGTGIGLSICKKIAQNHGGDIWIESEEGKGSTFFFTVSKKLQPTIKVVEKQQFFQAA